MVHIYETHLMPTEHKSNAYVLDENGVVIFSTGVTTYSVKKHPNGASPMDCKYPQSDNF